MSTLESLLFQQMFTLSVKLNYSLQYELLPLLENKRTLLVIGGK